MQISTGPGLEWSSDEEGTAGAHPLDAADLIDLSGNSSARSAHSVVVRVFTMPFAMHA